MTASFRLTTDAQSDLLDIRRFTLNRWGDAQSKSYLTDLRNTVKILAESPAIGRKRPDVGDGVYSFPHASHIIYYLMHDQFLVVFGVLHKHMVPSKHLDERSLD